MRPLDQILLPVDFSERSAGAARYAKTLARHFHSEVTLLHVLTPPHYEFGALEIGGSMLTELYANRLPQVQKELDAFAPDLAGTRLVLEGDPARRVVEFAHDKPVGLIVMPTHGYGPFRRFILGSITAKVLHDADCPVWTGVHLEDAPVADEIPIRRIVCAIDLGPQSCKALEWASSVQAAFGARMTVVHAAASDAYAGEIHGEIEGLQARYGGSGADVRIERGDPPKAVCETAADVKADLLVIGRGSAAGVFGRLRANAYTIIRESPCPVVSV